MKRIIKLTESDLTRIVRRIIKEDEEPSEEKVLRNGAKILMSSTNKEFKQYKIEIHSDNDKKNREVIELIKSNGGYDLGPTASSAKREGGTRLFARTTTFILPSDFNFDNI
jgi:hypothetical protein